MKYKMNREIIAKLEQALDAATLERCSVGDEHKKALRLYMQTWVEWPLRDALSKIKGERT